jgi:hypothetical protein
VLQRPLDYPIEQLVAVRFGNPPKTEALDDELFMVAFGSGGLGIIGEGRRLDVELTGQVSERGFRNASGVFRKKAEKTQGAPADRESQAVFVSASVADFPKFILGKREKGRQVPVSDRFRPFSEKVTLDFGKPIDRHFFLPYSGGRKR